MIKRMNKRGQPGFTTVEILVAIAALVLLIVLVSRGLGGGGKVVTSYEQSLYNSAVTNCAASTNLQAFCSDLKDIGNNNYATCDSVLLDVKNKPGVCDAGSNPALKLACENMVTKFPAKAYTLSGEKSIDTKTDCGTVLNR